MLLRWDIFKVQVQIDQIAAGLRANISEVEFAVIRNRPSDREFRARQALGEDLPTDAQLIGSTLEVLPSEEEVPAEVATFRRCGHGYLYIPNNYPRAVFQSAADATVSQVRISRYVVASQLQFYPEVIHLCRDGVELSSPDEVRELRGSILGYQGPRAIVQRCEVVYNVSLEFLVFALNPSRKPGPIGREHLEAWLDYAPSAFSPHRKMGFGGIKGYEIEAVGSYEGSPRGYAPWESLPLEKGWLG